MPAVSAAPARDVDARACMQPAVAPGVVAVSSVCTPHAAPARSHAVPRPRSGPRPSLPADAGKDTLRGPWVRMHAQPDETEPCIAQKTYFDITIGGAPAGRIVMQLETET